VNGTDIHVIENGPRDWLVTEVGGRELGHYPTQGEAEIVGVALARKRKGTLVIRTKSGAEQRKKPRRGFWGRLFGGG
jgi:hypothetical protein